MKFPLIWRWVHDEIVRDLEVENIKLRSRNAKLINELFRSKKNDTPKDPKTGRFTKKT